MCIKAGSSSSQVITDDPVEFRKELVRYIISTNPSFSHVESKGFGRFVHYLVLGIQLIKRKTLRKEIMKKKKVDENVSVFYRLCLKHVRVFAL